MTDTGHGMQKIFFKIFTFSYSKTLTMINLSYTKFKGLKRQLSKGLENLFEIERVRDREGKLGYSPHKGTKTLV